MFFWRATIPAAGPGAPAVDLAITDRGSGRGTGPYAGLNLGGHVGDDPAIVESNRRKLADALGVPRQRLLFLRQVHGDTVLEARGPWAAGVPEADGAVTAEPELAIAVLVADCVPVLLHDARAGVVGAVHAGRRGMLAGIARQAVSRMRSLGASELRAVVGPSVCGRCYEVSPRLAEAAAAASPASAASSWSGTPAIDVAAGVVAQLTAEGVSVRQVPGCTREDDRLYSYRGETTTGRFAGVVVLRRTPRAAG